MVDSFEIQTEAQVKAIESRKMIHDMIKNQDVPISNDNISTSGIENKISDIADTIDNIVVNKIDNIDTNMIEAQNADMLIKIQNQQAQIDSLEKKIDMLLEKK